MSMFQKSIINSVKQDETKVALRWTSFQKFLEKVYDIYRILSDFNIYPLVQHKYKYKEEEIIFYNTNINNENWELSEISLIFSILKTDENFKDSQVEDFIYDKAFTKELKKIYIDNKDEIKHALDFSNILIYKNQIIQNEKTIHQISLTYD